MHFLTNLLDHLLNAPAWAVYLTVTALVFAEDALFFGFVIPGETAAVLGGVAASRGHVELLAMCLLVITAAIVGDSVGYEVGRHYGPRILGSSRLARHRKRLGDAQDLLARRGGSAVLMGRFVAFFRAVMPALAGSSRMPYRKFLAYNAAGGLCWAITFVLLGNFAGNAYARIAKDVGRGAAVTIAVITITALLVWRIRVHRRETSEENRQC